MQYVALKILNAIIFVRKHVWKAMLNVSFTEIGGFMFEERVNDGGINVLYFYTEFCIFVELFYFKYIDLHCTMI